MRLNGCIQSDTLIALHLIGTEFTSVSLREDQVQRLEAKREVFGRLH